MKLDRYDKDGSYMCSDYSDITDKSKAVIYAKGMIGCLDLGYVIITLHSDSDPFTVRG